MTCVAPCVKSYRPNASSAPVMSCGILWVALPDPPPPGVGRLALLPLLSPPGDPGRSSSVLTRAGYWITPSDLDWLAQTSRSVSTGDQVVRLFPGGEPADLLDRDRVRTLSVTTRAPGDVRCQQQSRHCPQWMIRRQRFGIGHVECRP